MRKFITDIIDFFYPLFRKFMPLQTFRYAACGGGNALFGLMTYVVSYRFIFREQVLQLGFFAFEPHSAALFISSGITFVLGFVLNRYVVFTSSNLRGRIQLFRYFLSFSFNLVINYFMLKLLVEVLHWEAVLSQVFTISLVIVISYFTQHHFTFRVKKDGAAQFTELE